MTSAGRAAASVGEEEIGAVAGPGGAVFQILGCEARGDGIAQGGTIGFGERDQLRRG